MSEESRAAFLKKRISWRDMAIKKAQDLPWLLVLWFFCAYFMGRAGLLGSLFPFAPAFMGAAAAYYGRRSLFLLPSVLLGLFHVTGGGLFLAYAACAMAITVIFLFYPTERKKQLYIVPIMVVAVSAVGKGLAVSLWGGTTYDLLISGFESVLAAALSLVILVMFRACENLSVARRFAADEIACCFMLLLGVLGGMTELTVSGISLQAVLSCFIILSAAYLGGSGTGSAVGALIGIIPSLSQVISPTLVASYAFAGLLAGVFNSFGRVGAAMGFLFGNLLMAFYVPEADQISASLTAGTVAAIIFFLVPNIVFSKLAMAFNIMPLKTAAEEKSEKLLKLSGRKLKNAGYLFRDLAQSLQHNADEETGAEDNLKMVISSLDKQLCRSCSLRDICWKVDYLNTYRGVLAMFKSVEKKGSVEARDVPDSFSRRCPHLKELVILVNCLYELYCRSNFWATQRKSTRKLIESQMTGVARILDGLAHEVADKGVDRELLQRELCMGIQASGLPAENAGIDTMNEKYIETWVTYTVCPGEKRCRRAMENEIERVLGSGYIVSEIICGCQSKGQRCTYRVLADDAVSLQIGKAQCAKDQKNICGDSSEAVLLDCGKEILMLSDGMGVGKKAQAQSAYALELIARFLEAGFDHDTAIDMVNAAMTLKGREESFVTLDICLIDLYTREAEFLKMGGAPSFVKRGNEVRLIRGKGLPVGMLSKVEKDVISEKLLPNDMIVMASDGLLEGDNKYDAEWLRRVLEGSDVEDPQELAEYLLDKVLNITGGRLKDDITVMVTKLVS